MVHKRETDNYIDQLHEWMIKLGYQEKQVQTWPKYEIKQSTNGKNIIHQVGLAVFRGEERKNEDLILIAECESRGNTGMEQLYKYLKSSGCPLGIWYDGNDIAVVIHARDALSEVLIRPGQNFAKSIKQRREELELGSIRSGIDAAKNGKKIERSRFSIREVAKKAGIQPTYLSKIEREEVGPPSEGVINKIAIVLGMDANGLMLAAGKMPADLQRALMIRPDIATQLINAMKDDSSQAIKELIVQRKIIREGEW